MNTVNKKDRMPKNLVLVRHGESEGNVVMAALKKGDDSFYTKEFKETHDSDYRLSMKGIVQAKQLGLYIEKNFGPNYFSFGFVSAYIRALETASFIDMKWQIRTEIIERDWGELGVLSPKERDEKYPGWERLKKQNPYYWRPQGGERMAEVCNRAKMFLETLARQYSDDNVIVVVHGEFMWAMSIWLERINPIEYKKLDQSRNPLDRIYNCQVLHYTRQNPFSNENEIHDKINWRKSVCPWDFTKSKNEWERIKDTKFYSTEEIKNIYKETPRLFQ